MYSKQTWKNGDVITEDKLNHIEDGIATGGGKTEAYLAIMAFVISYRRLTNENYVDIDITNIFSP